MIETLILWLVVRWRWRVSSGPLDFSFYDSWQTSGESRFGPRFWTPLAALLFLALACLYVGPTLHPTALGRLYAELSQNPFAGAGNDLSFRFLTPLISHLLGLRGDWILITNLLLAALLLGMVHRHFSRKATRPGDAIVAPLTITYSMVTLFTVRNGGYCDSLTYVLLLGSWLLRRRAWAFCLMFFLSLLNRESVLFLIPWLIFIRVQVAGLRWRTGVELALGFSLSVLSYLGIRQLIASGQDIELTFHHYAQPMFQDPFHWMRETVRYWWLGFFSVFKILWLLPAWAAISSWRSGQRSLAYSMGLLLFCSWLQLAVAFDTSRMFTMAFPVMILALEYLFRERGEEVRGWIPKLLVINLFIPQIHTAASSIEIYHSPLTRVMLNLLALPE